MNRIICSTIFLIFLSSRIFAESNMMVFKILQNVPAFNSVSLQYLEETMRIPPRNIIIEPMVKLNTS